MIHPREPGQLNVLFVSIDIAGQYTLWLTSPVLDDIGCEHRQSPALLRLPMECFVWHKDQKAICHCLAAILKLAGDSNQCIAMRILTSLKHKLRQYV